MVGVVNEFAGGDLAAGQGILQRGEDQVGVRAGGGFPGHDPAGERVADRGQPQRPLPGGDHGQVGDPQLVRPVRGEVAPDQVRGQIGVRVTASEALAPSGADPGEASLAHEPLDALAADVDTLTLEDGVHAG